MRAKQGCLPARLPITVAAPGAGVHARRDGRASPGGQTTVETREGDGRPEVRPAPYICDRRAAAEGTKRTPKLDDIRTYIDAIAKIVELIGVVTILFGILYSLVRYLYLLNKPRHFTFTQLRQALGKSILLGLEILIAADIMATIITEPTLRSVSILGLIVFIRTLLSLSLQVELEGRFPWQKKPDVPK